MYPEAIMTGVMYFLPYKRFAKQPSFSFPLTVTYILSPFTAHYHQQLFSLQKIWGSIYTYLGHVLWCRIFIPYGVAMHLLHMKMTIKDGINQ